MPFDLQASQTARHAGALARFSFYVTGTLVFGVVAVAVLTVWNKLSAFGVDPSQPVIQLSVPELAKVTPQARATKSGFGWHELVQFGQLHDRDADFTLAVEMPKESSRVLPREFRREMGDLRQLSHATFSYPEAYYDLETRFGPVRAARFQIKADGRFKLCMGYVSRFETGALAFKGWYCEANGGKPSPYGLACLIDKVTVKGPLPSEAAQAFFLQRAARGPRCTADPVTQTTDTSPRKPLKRLVY